MDPRELNMAEAHKQLIAPKSLELLVFCSVLIACIVIYKLFGFHYSFNRDTWHYAYTTHNIINEQIRDGCLPFWNQYSALGSPLLMSGSIDLIFLPLLLLLSVMDYMVITGFICLLAGIYFMYKYLQSEHFPPILALTGAVVWNFNGLFLWHLHEVVIHLAFMLTPVILILIKNMSSNIYPVFSWLLLVAANFIHLSTGRWDCVEYSVLIGMFYIFIVVQYDSRSKKISFFKKTRLIILYFAAIIFAFIVIAPFTFSYIEVILNTYRNNMIATDYLSYKYFLNMFLPNLNKVGSRFYMPLMILPFVFLSLIRIDRLKLFALVLVVAHLLLAYPIGLFDIIRKLPMHSGHVVVLRTFLMYSFGISILFTCGLRDYLSQSDKRYNRIFFASGLLFLLMLIITSIAKLHYHNLSKLILGHHFGSIVSCIFILGAFVVLKDRLSHSRLKAFTAISVIVYTVFFGTLFNRNDLNDGNLEVLKSQYLGGLEQDYVGMIKSRHEKESLDYRVMFQRPFHAGFHEANFLESINFYTPLPSYSIGLVSTKVLGNDRCYNKIKLVPDNSIFYPLSSVRYLVTSGRDRDEFKEIKGKLIYDKNDVIVLEYEEVFARIRFVDEYKVIPSYEDSINFIANGSVGWFRSKFIVNEDPLIPSFGGDNVPAYELLDNSYSQIKIRVNSAKETMMILNNAYDRGWRLKVDGEVRPIYRVNAYFQGVKITPGTHVYQFYYVPLNLWLYLIISLAACCALVAVGLICSRSKRAVVG
jgi:hypothetical protein